MNIQRYVNIDFGTGKYADTKVRVDELDFTPDQPRFANVLIDSTGEKYISNSLLTTLQGDTIGEFPAIRWGSARFYKVTPDRLDTFLHHAQYTRRNGFEQAVANRNLDIITKIIDL